MANSFRKSEVSVQGKVNSRSGNFWDMLKKTVSENKTTVIQDMLLCTAISMTCAFYEFEGFFMPFAIDIIKGLLLFLFISSWLWCSFSNGYKRKYSFLIFTLLYWLVPRLLIIWADSIDILNYNKFINAAGEFSKIFVEYSVQCLTRVLTTSIFFATIVLLLFCLSAYYIGNTVGAEVRKANRQSGADDNILE